jgi:hypothetical protein
MAEQTHKSSKQTLQPQRLDKSLTPSLPLPPTQRMIQYLDAPRPRELLLAHADDHEFYAFGLEEEVLELGLGEEGAEGVECVLEELGFFG